MDKKMELLTRIAAALNREKAVWAVGGSMMLYFKGVVTEFRDIDLMVGDGALAADALRALGATEKPVQPDPRFLTRGFWKFVLDGVDVDIMAGFAVVHEGRSYSFPLKATDIHDAVTLQGEAIPLQSIGEWREFYRLMDRREKVELIDAWTLKNGGQ